MRTNTYFTISDTSCADLGTKTFFSLCPFLDFLLIIHVSWEDGTYLVAACRLLLLTPRMDAISSVHIRQLNILNDHSAETGKRVPKPK